MNIIKIDDTFSFSRDGSGWVLLRYTPPGQNINKQTGKASEKESVRRYYYPTLVMLLTNVLDIAGADVSGDVQSLKDHITKLADGITVLVKGLDSSKITSKVYVPEEEDKMPPVVPEITKAVVKIARRKAKPLPSFRSKD